MSNYRLIFLGEITEQFHIDEVKRNFKKTFQLSDTQLKYIFSGKEVILKKSITKKEALNFVLKIDMLGGISYIEKLNIAVQLPAGILSNRRRYMRRNIFNRRRKYRAGLASERRYVRERRAKEE